MSTRITDEEIERRRSILIDLRRLYDRLEAASLSSKSTLKIALTKPQIEFFMAQIERVFRP